MSPNEREFFNDMNLKKINLVEKIKPMLAHIPLVELKTFFKKYDALKPIISNIETADEVIDEVQNHCTITDVSYLKNAAKFFKIDEVLDHIKTFSQEVDDCCEGLLIEYCMHQSFRNTRYFQLTCNTIKFVLQWDPSKREMNDIRGILWKTFQCNAKDIQVVGFTKGNSIVISCYAPQSLMTLLMMRAKKNLEFLEEEGVMSLFVGYYTVLDHKSKEQVQCC